MAFVDMILIPQMDLLADGWVQMVDPLPGWEAFTVDLRADLVNGEPRITGIRLEPRKGASKVDAVLTANRLRTVPVTALAASVYYWQHLTPATLTDLVEALKSSTKELAERQPARTGGRRVASAEEVAEVYRNAQIVGSIVEPGKGTRRQAPREAVCKALNISPRTADRYISEARRRGLLAPYDSREEQE